MTTEEKLTTVAENQQKVYDAGCQKGKDEYYDAFWDAYQDHGNRTYYGYAFAGAGWNNETFAPKYNIVLGDADGLLSVGVFSNSRIRGDFAEVLNSHGVVLDGSKSTQPQYMFAGAKYITRIGVLDLGKAYNGIELFKGCESLETIDKLTLSSASVFTNCFYNCISLKNITMAGTLNGTIDFSYSPLLTAASIENIMSVLSTTATGKTVTFNKTAVEAAFTTDEWNALKATKTNWTIALA